jgi:heme exporter protein D
VLWAALSESPYDDARGFLVRHLGERVGTFGPETLRHVWATSLLAVHRGGRAKRAVVNQVGARIAERPAEAESLLPLLAVALRSVRAPERRTALAAVARAALREPRLKGAIARALPELKLAGEVAV